MYPQKDPEKVKSDNVIDMAVTFTAMVRVFESGSKEKIVSMLKKSFTSLDSIKTEKNYRDLHKQFCSNFTKTIKTARKKLKNGNIKKSKPASYGQAAKVLDIAIKVYVYYCGLPRREVSEKVVQLLFGAIDTPILNHLKSKFPEENIEANTIENITKSDYDKLQSLLQRDISDGFSNQIMPVQYDDIMWNYLNRKKA